MIEWRTFFFYVGVWLYLSLTSNKQSVPIIHEKKGSKSSTSQAMGSRELPLTLPLFFFFFFNHKEHRILCFLFYSFQIFSLSLFRLCDFNHFFVPHTRESDLWYRHTDWKWNRRTKKIVIRLKKIGKKAQKRITFECTFQNHIKKCIFLLKIIIFYFLFYLGY